jgi:uncharacterized protein YndB with AHSA1/START domain
MSSSNGQSSSIDVILTRVFDVPADRVWRAWTEGEQVRRWWGPRGFSAPLARMDVREGGTSLVCMRAPKEYGGQDMYNTWTYSRVVPHERLEFVLRFADETGQALAPEKRVVPPGVPDAVRHVVTFKAAGPGRTEMTVTEYGYTTKQAHDLSRSGLVECVDKMEESFATSERPAAP